MYNQEWEPREVQETGKEWKTPDAWLSETKRDIRNAESEKNYYEAKKNSSSYDKDYSKKERNQIDQRIEGLKSEIKELENNEKKYQEAKDKGVTTMQRVDNKESVGKSRGQ